MKILGNRVLVSKIEEPKTDGFQTVEVQDSFVYKGKIEQTGILWTERNHQNGEDYPKRDDIILFAKYSPDTQEVNYEGQKMKIINVDDILAVL